ncbi:MAG: DUF6340 family protein [Bacteroidota bacterium]
MRKFKNSNTILILVISILLSSCSSTNKLTLSVNEPSLVYIPSNIKSIGIIDRSLPSKEIKKIDDIDKVLSIEGKNLDEEGANISVNGLFDELVKSEKFSEVKIIDGIQIKNPGIGIFPTTISWETLEQISIKYNVDAIYSLSFYDTDAIVNYNTVPVEITGPLGVKIPAIEHHTTINTLIKTGWRIYDINNKNVLDEFIFNENVTSKGVGINPVNAAKAIIGRKESVLQVSKTIGQNYALRIFPFKMRVSRDYFVRGSDNFVIAKRRAQTGNWDGAAELWSKEVSNPKKEIAGRACYNMAIINEINGDLDTAVEWASKSYTDYKNKTALRYLKILKYRIEKNNQLQQQTALNY